jgi:glycerol kinase
MMEYYLGVDLGSTNIKAMILSEHGDILSFRTSRNPIKRQDHKARQDLFYLFTQAKETIDRCIEDSKLDTKQITLMALSSQRESFAFFDASGYSPLFTWQDPTKPKDLNLSAKHKIATLDTLFIHFLSDKKLFVTDPTHESYAKFQDCEAMKAEVIPSLSNFGTYRNIPIKVSVADLPASLYALGHSTVLSLGTGVFFLSKVDEDIVKNGTQNNQKKYIGLDVDGTRVSYQELSLPYLAPILLNLVEHFSPQRTMEELESLAAGTFHTKGLFYHPELEHLRGFSVTTGLCEWSRSVIEGFVFSIKELIEQMQKKQHTLYSMIPVTGGVSKSNYMMQLLSDLSGVGLQRPRLVDTDILGAIKLASSNPLEKLLEEERVFIPQANGVLLESYHLWRKAFYES